MGPLVARVSAAITTPPSKRQPTIVVPVLVALGRGTPCAWRAILRLWLLKSNPPMVMSRWKWSLRRAGRLRSWLLDGRREEAMLGGRSRKLRRRRAEVEGVERKTVDDI